MEIQFVGAIRFVCRRESVSSFEEKYSVSSFMISVGGGSGHFNVAWINVKQSGNSRSKINLFSFSALSI